METPFFKSSAVVTRTPNMAYLSAALQAGRLRITWAGILDQDFETADGRVQVTREHAGRRFLGGGIHEFSFFRVVRDGHEVFRAKFADYPYLYVERYLKAKGE